uniref:Uncharacterized protein n=1 Tax=Panagrolaimus sp. PS1159 TaxID=55785 RepID=A0AC35GEM1_9BILA
MAIFFLKCQRLTFNELQNFTTSGIIKAIHLERNVLIDENGKIVPFEEVLKTLVSIKSIYFEFSKDYFTSINCGTVFAIIDILEKHEFYSFTLSNIPECFEFQPIFDYMQKPNIIRPKLSFSLSISDSCQKRINAAIPFCQKDQILYNVEFPGKYRSYF